MRRSSIVRALNFDCGCWNPATLWVALHCFDQVPTCAEVYASEIDGSDSDATHGFGDDARTLVGLSKNVLIADGQIIIRGVQLLHEGSAGPSKPCVRVTGDASKRNDPIIGN